MDRPSTAVSFRLVGMRKNDKKSTNMAPFTINRRARGPLLVVSVVVIVLLVLRAFTNVRFGGGSVFGKTRSKEISMLTFNIWFSLKRHAREWKL